CGQVAQLAKDLHLKSSDLDQLECTARRIVAEQGLKREWTPPVAVPLVSELLALAADNRRLRQSHELERLEQHVDCLQTTVESQHALFAQELEECKLAAMAEFAAGAGHEINNPLAVISGQAQYLIRSLEEETPLQRLVRANGQG